MRDGGVSISIGEKKKLLPGAFRAETTKRSLLCGPADVRKTRWDPVLQQQLTHLTYYHYPTTRAPTCLLAGDLNHAPSSPPTPTPYSGDAPGLCGCLAGWLLTQVVGAAQVEGVAAVHVVVQSLLNEVLRFVPRQLRHSAESNPRGMRAGCRGSPHPTQPSQTWVPTLNS